MAYRPKSKVKALGQTVVNYAKEAAKKGVHIPELEALTKYFGKKGQVLARPTRSKKSQHEFEKAIAAAKEKFGTKPKKKDIEKEFEHRKAKAEQERKKAEKTYRQRKVKEAKQAGKNFRSAAQKAARQYGNVVDVLQDAATKKLMESYGIGSDFIEYLAEMGMSSADIKKFLQELAATIDDIPEEARALATTDRVLGTFMELHNNYNDEEWSDVSAMFNMSINHQEASMEDLTRVIDAWQAAGGADLVPFEQLQYELEQTMDPFNIDTVNEILEDMKDGD